MGHGVQATLYHDTAWTPGLEEEESGLAVLWYKTCWAVSKRNHLEHLPLRVPLYCTRPLV